MTDYNFIESRALEIRERFGIAETCYIDVRDLALQQGITIHERNLGEDVYGMLVMKNGKAAIGLESDQSEVRKRFTIAHELGHYYLHQNVKSTFVDDAIFKRSSKTNQFEREANAFAASLLMPEALVKKVIESKGWKVIEDNEINQLAKIFEVSPPSMTFRLINLKVIEPPQFLE